MQHLQPNTTLQGGKYRIERVLGQGGFGITYMAVQTPLGRYVAIKELFVGGSGQAINDRRGSWVVVTNSANQASFDQQREKFKKEALRLANLNHPNLVKVHEFFEENGTAYYVMDYIDGESLRTKLNREGVLSESLVLKYMRQLLPALEAAHRQSIWHLDIKPENIMVDRYDHIYLIDFGASKHIEQNSTLTTSLTLAYTKGYCPPELADLTYGTKKDLERALKEIGPWTDIYALGATMYNLLTDSIPPSSNRLFQVGRNAFMFPNGVSESTKNLIVWMMEPNKDDRPQSISFLAKYLIHNKASGRGRNAKQKENFDDAIILEKTKRIEIIDEEESTYMSVLKQHPDMVKSAKRGDKTAQYELALWFEKHAQGSIYKEEAYKWYLKAATNGHADALYKLGYCHEIGFGVKKSISTALNYYQKAAMNGNAMAQYYLGSCYEEGRGVQKDTKKAKQYYQDAAAQGNKYAISALSRLKKAKWWENLFSI